MRYAKMTFKYFGIFSPWTTDHRNRIVIVHGPFIIPILRFLFNNLPSPSFFQGSAAESPGENGQLHYLQFGAVGHLSSSLPVQLSREESKVHWV
jgi:hypothetical protein